MSANRVTRTFGTPQSPAADEHEDTQAPGPLKKLVTRMSFTSIRRSVFDDGEPLADKAPVPTVMQAPEEVYQTPLPTLSMIVLSIALLGEFLSANVCTPFLLFMVEGFGTLKDEAEVAFWTGLLVSTFFLTQFLTSMLWATVADRHGRRFVLVTSLLGSAITCAIFGTCTSLNQAICVRLLQGIFGGAVGVARGSISFVTDSSNEGRAYAILGFCWGFGGVAGAIIGGTFETPVKKWPSTFESLPIFVTYPYLLPVLLASSITFLGAVLGCFLGPDGGPREGAIKLAPEKDNIPPTIPEEAEESAPPSPVFDDDEIPTRDSISRSIGRRLSNRLSGYFSSIPPQNPPNVTPSLAVPLDRTRTFSGSRPRRPTGSAYGYSSFRNRLASGATIRTRRGSNASSMRRRRESNRDDMRRDSTTGEDLNFAQRLLVAHGDAVANIADLWVASAMNVDNEDPFESDDEMDDENSMSNDIDGQDDVDGTPTPRDRRFSNESGSSRLEGSAPYGTARRPSSFAPRGINIPGRKTSFNQPHGGSPLLTPRRASNVPSIFAHPGVKTPPAVDAQQLLLRQDSDNSDALAPILESRRQSFIHPDEDVEAALEKQPSLFSQLPKSIILQYGLLALHSTTHDQVFMSYLVTEYDSGGLNLNAGHFAQLIALMCLCQIAYQFYLYPNIGPPRGKFSHLAMFRLGSFLFIPAYVTVTLYRVPFASEEEDGNFALMAALAVSTAVRFCGSTFAYTSVSILLNYMTPPHAVGIANGIAQSIVSLARCLGPVFGGWLWSVSIEGNPSGYPLGFFVCGGVCAVAILHSFIIR
ncbi:major facilitator superfamily MFS-1 [Cylindrobasidium torrendii FP15055 ss-10]|uniref:Major facilitator superfamily MFS-1 n=1 Tax=Cylindrobasidium torrendii FP15055 ss-10 TaxID=1314674 RepID=A0A0D7BJR0_9AGAR|nr:major facilitator superfamily MFS-1 [Cylindrobasidium torrendii FP15055 ss-10]